MHGFFYNLLALLLYHLIYIFKVDVTVGYLTEIPLIIRINQYLLHEMITVVAIHRQKKKIAFKKVALIL